jgi:hypothetical protein
MAFPMASEAWSFIISARLELSLFVAALVVPALSESESLVNLDDLPSGKHTKSYGSHGPLSSLIYPLKNGDFL